MKSFRLSHYCLLITLIGLALSATAQARSGLSAHVYLLRGIFNVSVGLDALAAKLSQVGIATTVYGHDEEGNFRPVARARSFSSVIRSAPARRCESQRV